MKVPMSAKVWAHETAWKLGYDVMPIGSESRSLVGSPGEEVARLLGVVQRVLGYSREVADGPAPSWTRLVAEAFSLAADGHSPRGQLLQDAWVTLCTGRKRDGYFVDIGAADGYYLSNTVMLERSFGWTGLLCEPNPDLRAAIARIPRPGSVVVPEAVWDRSGVTLELVLADEMSAFQDNAGGDVHARGRSAAAGGRTASVVTATPGEILDRHDSPAVIDFLSIDTEGSELDILRAFPWHERGVRLLAVEHNHTPGRAAAYDAFLVPLGFRRSLPDWSAFDAWYVHESLEVHPALVTDPP